MTNDTFIEEKNKQTNRPIKLFTIYDYDNLGTDLHYVNSRAAITYNGITYEVFPLEIDNIKENTFAQVVQAKIVFAGTSRIILYYLLTYGWHGKKIDVLTVFEDELLDASAYKKNTYYIDSYGNNQKDVFVNVTGKLDVTNAMIPLRNYDPNYCQWLKLESGFKGDQCGYTGDEATCDGSLARCRVLGNSKRYGGFPSVRNG